MAAPVIIEPYDPAWPERFAVLRAALAGAMGELALAIEHVGSTSVPGLAAKPIIDIDVVIAGEAQLAAATERLALIGYAFEGDLGVPRRWAYKSPPGTPQHHMYVCAANDQHIVFRDYLRRHPDAARAYEALKYAAAEQHRHDRTAYGEAKRAWVMAALDAARAEAEERR